MRARTSDHRIRVLLALLSVGGLLTLVPAVASAIQVVVPNANATVDGNIQNILPFSCVQQFISKSARYQQVYNASETGSGTIREIRFRKEGVAASISFTIPSVTIRLSSTSNGPDTLSATFASNLGSDVTTVFSGALTLSSPTSLDSPQPFGIVIPLTTPFFFSASAGKNLLLDVTIPECAGTIPFDAEATTSDSVSRVIAFDAGATTGAADTAGLVTQFSVEVVVPQIPTASSRGMMILGLAFLGAIAWMVRAQPSRR